MLIHLSMYMPMYMSTTCLYAHVYVRACTQTVVPQQDAATVDPREALRALSKRHLRIKAEQLGVLDQHVQDFGNDEITKEHFIDIVLSKMSAML